MAAISSYWSSVRRPGINWNPAMRWPPGSRGRAMLATTAAPVPGPRKIITLPARPRGPKWGPGPFKVAGHVGDDGGLCARLKEDHHVAGQDDGVEVAAEVDCRKVGQVPVDGGRLASRGVEHLRIDVGADNVEATAGQLAADAARPAAGVKHGLRAEGLDEIRLAVDVLAGGGAALVRGVVYVAGDGALAEPAVRVGHFPNGSRSREILFMQYRWPPRSRGPSSKTG